MTRKSITAGAYVAAAVLSLAVAPRSLGQTAPAAAPAAGTPAADEEVVILSPFVVSAAEDKGYRATSTLAGTRIKTDLRDVGSAISVVTEKFLSDTASRKAEDLLVYTTNTEVSGQGGSFAGGGDGSIVDTTNRNSPVSNTRVRGLAEADNTRDFFLSDIPWDSYNVGRVDLQRGPNAILFGIGSPAGIVNSSLNQAALTDANKIEASFGSYGTNRFSGDFNKVLLEDELAIRVSLLRDDTSYKQDPAYRLDKRAYAAFRWDPKFLKTDSARTSMRVNFETGKIRSNLPRYTPPMDAITPWFAAMNKQGYDQRTVQSGLAADWAADAGAGAANTTSTNYEPWLFAAGNRVYDGIVTAWTPATGQGVSYVATPRTWPDTVTSDGGAYVPGMFFTTRGITLYDKYATQANLEYAAIGAYKAKSLTDSSIFDFYNNLLEGENKNEWTEFDAYNVALEQTFLDNRIGVEFVYDNQDTTWGQRRYISGDAAAITVDVMTVLADGSVNPNFGKPMVVAGGGSAGGNWTERKREVMRATAFGKFDFRDVMDKKSGLAKALGVHTFTALWTRQENKTEGRNWSRYYIGNDYGPNADRPAGESSRDVTIFEYLSDYSLANATSPSGLNLSRIKGKHAPNATTIQVFDNTPTAAFDALITALHAVDPAANPTFEQIENYANYKGWTRTPLNIVNNDRYGNDAGTYTNGVRTISKVDSQAFVWQGSMFEGTLVPMLGWRKDTELFRSAGVPPKFASTDVPNGPYTGKAGLVDMTAPWEIPTEEVPKGARGIYSKETGESLTWSVVAHTPKFINDKLPYGLKFSGHFNKSENFQPDASRQDIIGNRVPSPNGQTREYGFTVSALDDKIILKANWYKTTMTNATVNGAGIRNSYLLGAAEAWGQQAAVALKNNTGAWPADSNFGTSTSGGILRWQPAGNGTVGLKDGKAGAYSQAEIDAQYAAQQASMTAWLANPIPASMQKAWGMTGYATGGSAWSGQTIAITGDTESKGMEFELTANPLTGLDISFNASKTTAKRLNLAQSYTSWIEGRWAQFQGPLGDMRIWGAANNGETVRSKYANEVMGDYGLQLLLNNSDVPELRPWHFNVTANYAFQNVAALKGVNVGMSYRWQDKVTTGFPVINVAGEQIYDIKNPWKGSAEDAFDCWVGYERAITEKLKWRVQLNVRNVFGSRELIPITVQPDGSPAAYRIPEPTTWSLTNTFSF